MDPHVNLEVLIVREGFPTGGMRALELLRFMMVGVDVGLEPLLPRKRLSASLHWAQNLRF